MDARKPIWDHHPEIWEDDAEPEVRLKGQLFRIRTVLKNVKLIVEMIVYHDDSIEILRCWGFKKETVGFASQLTPEINRDVMSWLEEWELAELRKVGPEDHEWFVTEKFDSTHARS